MSINAENKELKKHVNAIHCSNNLTLVQRKLFNALLFNAYPDLPHKQRFEIKSKDLCKLIGYNSNDIKSLKQALLGLMKIAIEWNVIGSSVNDKEEWRASAILASAELFDGVCIYEYSKIMKDLLYHPDIYGRIDIGLISRFKSSYGLALYENCIRYSGLPQTPWFPIDVFRKLMGVFDNKYNDFRNFKRRVINIAIKEVNGISPISAHPEIERVNQRAVKIRFKLSKNNQSLPHVLPILNSDKGRLMDTLSEIFGLSTEISTEICVQYGEKCVLDKIEMILHSEAFKGGKIKNLAGYLIKALKENYTPSKSSKIIIDKQRRNREEEKNEKNKLEKKRAERYRAYFTKKIKTYLDLLTKVGYEKLTHDFVIYIKAQNNTMLSNWYKEYGLEDSRVKACFYQFIKDNRKNEVGDLLSMEEFINLVCENN